MVEGLYVSEMNYSNETKDEKEELGFFCYCKIFTLPIKWYMLFERGL